MNPNPVFDLCSTDPWAQSRRDCYDYELLFGPNKLPLIPEFATRDTRPRRLPRGSSHPLGSKTG